MRRSRSLALSAALFAFSQQVAAARPSSPTPALAYEMVTSLTTEVGPRLAGTPAEGRARKWALSWLTRLGFANVHEETTAMPLWLRGEERLAVVSPFEQRLAVTAIGRSGATPPQGIIGLLVHFRSIDELKAAAPAEVIGKIVFLTHAMQRTIDESQYSAFAEVRRAGPSLASDKGAAAIVIRSLATGHRRSPHTGLTFWGTSKPIPAGALSIPDAENLERIIAYGRPVQLRLTLTPTTPGEGTTGNVIAEVRGSGAPNEIVLVAAHLDSWDLGTGAEDDGAGVAIVTDAVKRILERGRPPRRTIRIVLFGCEELGLSGANLYASAHSTDQHVVAIEMDHGSGPVLQLASQVSTAGRPFVEKLARSLGTFGVILGPNDVALGTDLGPLKSTGVPIISLHQEGLTYFDIHHTSDDTLDEVNPAGLEQASQVLSEVLWAVANSDQRF